MGVRGTFREGVQGAQGECGSAELWVRVRARGRKRELDLGVSRGGSWQPVVLQLTLKRGWVYSLSGEGVLVLTWARRTGAAETGTGVSQHKALC